MAKTQNDHLKSQEKHQDNGVNKSESLKPQIQQDQFGESIQLTQAVKNPEQATPNTIQRLQERYGNQEVRRIISPVKNHESAVQQGGYLNKYISDEIQRARSGGQPLQSDISDQMKSTFGNKIDNVRIHADQNSDHLSKKIQARAFTVGNDIFFRKGAYSPASEQGRYTLMHELTHVVQQSSSSVSSGPLKLGESDDKFEQEAEGFARGAKANNSPGSAKTEGVIQRLSMAGVKKSIGGIFSRGDKSGATTTSTPAPSTAPTPAPKTPPPVPATPAGLMPDEWALIQNAGVIDKKDWRSIDPNRQKAIFDSIKTEFPIAQKLVSAHKASSWPVDDKGAEIFDISKLKMINTTFMFDFFSWNNLKKEYKNLLFTFSTKPYIVTLAVLAKVDKWPKDGSDQDITDENIFKTITETWKISLTQWQSITEANQREFLLKNSAKPYSDELVRAAFQNKWPKNGSDQPILDDGIITKIRDDIGLNLWQWSQLGSNSRRGFLLSASGTLTNGQLNELAKSAISGVWPMNGGDQDISTANEWKKIKDAFPQMSPSYWNGFDKVTRTDALSKSDTAGIKKIINEANFQKKSKKNTLDVIGDVSGHALVDATTGTIGLTSSIIGASKGINDNTTLDRWSGGVGAVGDTASIAASGGSLLGGIGKYSRGKKLANDPNASRAAKEVGKKEKSKGSWGITQSAFGMAGSTASLGGNLTKTIDPESDAGKNTSSGFGVASGFLGMFGSALGVGKTGASINSARKRSNSARGFIKKAATGTNLSPEEEKLNKVASFTAKNQNKTGKGFGIFKGVTSFLASSLNTVGSIGSLAGMSNEAGFGLGVTSAVLSGFGILGGLGQWAAESTGKPKDADLEGQANNLIELLRLGDPKGKEAAKFVKDVLKINLVDLTDPNTWSNWIDEDEAAAKELIKSKLSKF